MSEELRKLAMAATPGPWESDLDMFTSEEGIVAIVFDNKEMMLKVETDLTIPYQEGAVWTEADSERRDAQWRKARDGQEIKDAAFIAAANPTAILALLDQISTLQAALKEVVDAWESLPGGRNYAPVIIKEWLRRDMASAIMSAREALGRKPPGKP